MGGIMRGGLPVATQALLNKPAKLEEDLHNMGQLYGQLAPEAEKAINAAKANNANITRIANDLGVESGIVAAVYTSNGGKEQDTRKQVLNMLKAHDNNIPTVETPISQKPAAIDETISVDSAPEAEISKTMMSSFAELFKLHGPDEVIRRFALKTGKGEDYVRKILSGAIGDLVPQFEYGVKPTSEAMLSALETPKEEDNMFSATTVTGQALANIKTIVNRVLSPNNLDQFSPEDINFASTAVTEMVTAITKGDEFTQELITTGANLIRASEKTGTEDKIPSTWKSLSENVKTLLGARITSKDITYDALKMAELSKLIPVAIASGNEDDWKKVNDLYNYIVENKVVKETTTTESLSEYQKNLKMQVENHFTKSLSDVIYDEGVIDGLNGALNHALQHLDNESAWKLVEEKLKKVTPKHKGPVETAVTAKKQTYKNALLANLDFLNQFKKEDGSYDMDTAKEMATKFANRNYELAYTDVTSEGIIYTWVPGADGDIVLKEARQPAPGGGQYGAGVTQSMREEINTSSRNVSTSLKSIYGLMATLTNDPNAFNFVRTGRFFAADVRDIINGVTGATWFNDAAALKNVGELQGAKQASIALISAAKDKLFDDPRLSDQDLKLVKEYIAVLDSATIGSTRGMAALIQLEKVFVTQLALNKAELYGIDAPLVHWSGDDIDLTKPSIAQELVVTMAKSNGLLRPGQTLDDKAVAFQKSQNEIDAMAAGPDKDSRQNALNMAKNNFWNGLDSLQIMATTAISSVEQYRNDPELYKTTHAGSATAMELTDAEQALLTTDDYI